MIKLIISLLILTILVLGAVLVIKEDPGFVLVQYAGQSLETTLATALVALVVASVIINVVLKIIFYLLRIGTHLKRHNERRRIEKSRILLNRGLIDLTEGRFAQAETKLTQLIDYTETPLLNYLAAARAAQHLGKFDQRDIYLKQAHQKNPDAEVAIGVTQGELQLTANQTERAYATLTHLHQKSPKHDYVIKLLSKVYLALEEWEKLSELLPIIKKKNLFVKNKFKDLEKKTLVGYLSQQKGSDLNSLQKLYQKLNKIKPNDTALLRQYIKLLESMDEKQIVLEKTIREALNNNWDKELILQYGLLDQIESNVLIAHAEQWQQNHQYDADLLLTLGRLARRSQLWGKAQSYLEASISAQTNPQNCLELAQLLENELSKPDEAIKYYQQGLKSCI